MSRGASLLLLAALGGFAAAPLFALDPPHHFPAAIKGPCNECHKLHKAPGGVLTSVAGNANLCLSCHVAGGQAAAKALADSDQALPAPGLPTGTSAAGTSHRWDSGVSGHLAKDAANTSTGKVASGGAYTGRYPKTYTLTITTAGNVGTAQFSWSATTPPGGSGGPLTIAASATPGVSQPIALDEGVSVTFTDSGNPSFLASAKWYVYVRPDLTQPTATAMALRIESGKIMCSTCHDQHSQAREPFDPAAPAYGGAGTGAGRHFQRIADDTNQMCTDCHTARNVTSSTSGSHPVAVSRSGGEYQNPTALPLDKTLGKVRCSTCHDVHYAPKTDGSLLRLASTRSLCSASDRIRSSEASLPISSSLVNTSRIERSGVWPRSSRVRAASQAMVTLAFMSYIPGPYSQSFSWRIGIRSSVPSGQTVSRCSNPRI